MKTFEYYRAASPADSTAAVAGRHHAMFFAGGTTLVDLMRIDVLTPDTLVDVNALALQEIDVTDDAIVVGAKVRNSALPWHPAVRERLRPHASDPVGGDHADPQHGDDRRQRRAAYALPVLP